MAGEKEAKGPVDGVPQTAKAKKPCCCKGKVKKVKPSQVSTSALQTDEQTEELDLTTSLQLPLYGNPYPPKDLVLETEAGLIEEGVRTARHSVAPYLKFLGGSGQRGKEMLETASAHSRATYDMITDEGNAIPKAVAITAGGLAGLLVASRRGFFKKILFTSIGMGSVAGACYPKQTAELAQVWIYIAKNKGPEMVKEYTGLDVTEYFKRGKDPQAVSQSAKQGKGPSLPEGAPTAAIDQSNPNDKDLYTTRGNK